MNTVCLWWIFSGVLPLIRSNGPKTGNSVCLVMVLQAESAGPFVSRPRIQLCSCCLGLSEIKLQVTDG